MCERYIGPPPGEGVVLGSPSRLEKRSSAVRTGAERRGGTRKDETACSTTEAGANEDERE
jgi:hypothetical protein